VKLTMATNRCSRSKPSSQSDMEILKIHALGISKHGEMDYEAADESCITCLTLNDDNPVTEDALAANFLIPLDEKMGGRGDLSSFDVSFFEKIDVVVISCCSLAAKKSVNEKCRKLSKRVAFYTVDCRDSCGEIFVDLQKYSYAQSKAASAFAISEDTYSEPLGRRTRIRLHISDGGDAHQDTNTSHSQASSREEYDHDSPI
ncbi:SUMO-activating enzyme subunit 1B-1-like protein, partial [Tanacetum coccineum]